MLLFKLPPLFSFILISVSITFLAFILLRCAFYVAFRDPHNIVSSKVLLKSFYIGLKFDVRLALLVHLPMVLLGWLNPLQLSDGGFGNALWCAYLVVVAAILLLFYVSDFGHYGYLEDRLDATAIRFLYNPKTSFQMIWESYPVVKWGVGFVLLVALYWVCIAWLIRFISQSGPSQLSLWQNGIAVTIGTVIYVLGVYGSLTHYPLRWSEAFFSTNSFASALALNPVLYFFTTLKNREKKQDKQTVQEHYDRIAGYLGVAEPDISSLNFARKNSAGTIELKKMNVVLVFLESFAYYKTSMSANPLDPTPHVAAMAKEALMFPRFYTPHSGTARSVFTAVTGLPDVERIKTSSRNPLVVRQHTIINAFEGYEKSYFLGGSANWGEIRGMLSHNIPGLRIFEEGCYSSPRTDGWGISDLHLFEEADRVFQGYGDKPFFSIIQTSGNHRPYTIPQDNRGFQLQSFSEDDAVKYGFESAQAVNSIRFMDHSVQFLLDAARRGGYFDNTMFVFLGDHGSARRHPVHMPRAEDALRLTRYRVPLIFYAPGMIRQGRIDTTVASEVDLLPTIASMLSVPYVNSTLGRDLLDRQFDSQRYAFTIQNQSIPDLGLIGDQFYLLVRADGTDKRLYCFDSETPDSNVAEKHPEVAATMEPLCRGLYETANYMRYHNAPEKIIS